MPRSEVLLVSLRQLPQGQLFVADLSVWSSAELYSGFESGVLLLGGFHCMVCFFTSQQKQNTGQKPGNMIE